MNSYKREDILNQLKQMNAPTDKIVLMHSSLRAIGRVDGGAEVLLDTLIEYFTRDGGLFCVPTHTWHNLSKEITLDMMSDDHCLGAFSTVALNDKRGIRSESPIHSMVVFGDKQKALDFVKQEAFTNSTTPIESCYGKIYSSGGKILLVGVSHSRNTYLHSVDEILGTKNRMADKPTTVTIRRKSGEIVKRELILYHNDFTDDISCRFNKFETAFRYHKCIVDGFLGNAPTQLCDAKKMKETLELIYKNSDGVDPLFDEKPIPQKWYC